MASFAGVASAPSVPSGPGGAATVGRKVIVVLQKASLETVKTKKGFELLNCDDHVGIHKKHNRNPAESRPDITHQLLLGEA